MIMNDDSDDDYVAGGDGHGGGGDTVLGVGGLRHIVVSTARCVGVIARRTLRFACNKVLEV